MRSYPAQARIKLSGYMDEALEKGTHLGLSLSLIDGGQNYFWNFGKKSSEDASSVLDEHCLFEVGSVGKVFTALHFSKLFREGRCLATDPVHRFVPELGRRLEFRLIDLLRHRSGLPREPENFKMIAPKNSYLPYRNEALLEAVQNIPALVTPGQFSYSSFGYLILGLIAERISGVAQFSDLLMESVISPLGLKDTRFRLLPADTMRFCHGHDEALSPVAYKDLGEVYDAAGGLKSSTADLSRLVGWLLCPDSGPGEFSTDFKRLLEMDADENVEITASFGLHRRRFEDGKIGWFHLGSLAGTKAAILFSPELQRGIAYCSNTLSHVSPRWDLLLGQ